jgi:hypothetical protein
MRGRRVGFHAYPQAYTGVIGLHIRSRFGEGPATRAKALSEDQTSKHAQSALEWSHS